MRELISLVPGPYDDSMCSEGGRYTHSTCSSWLVVRGLASPLASYLLTPACVGTPAGNAGSGNPIGKRAGGSTTCSVVALNVNSLALCGC